MNSSLRRPSSERPGGRCSPSSVIRRAWCSRSDSRIWKERLERASAVLARQPARSGVSRFRGTRWRGWAQAGWSLRHHRHQPPCGRGVRPEARRGVRVWQGCRRGDDRVDRLLESSMSGQLSRAADSAIEDEDGPDFGVPAGRTARPALASRLRFGGTAAAGRNGRRHRYPARDSRIRTLIDDRIYGTKYDRKRLAPGQILGRSPGSCSTIARCSAEIRDPQLSRSRPEKRSASTSPEPSLRICHARNRLRTSSRRALPARGAPSCRRQPRLG